MLGQAITLSILLGFLATEFLGLYTGGMVSAGYLAFFMEQPYRIASTLILSVIVCLAVKGLSKVAIIYGRRRFMAAVLLGILLAWIYENNMYHLRGISQDLRVIGYMIPGLLANDMLKQGICRTLLTALACAAAIRLILLAALGVL